jgi:hypothetical protein
MLGLVALVRTDVSEELSAFIIRVTRIGVLRKTLALTATHVLTSQRTLFFTFDFVTLYVFQKLGTMFTKMISKPLIPQRDAVVLCTLTVQEYAPAVSVSPKYRESVQLFILYCYQFRQCLTCF